jgi:hypothetical protein
MTPTEPHVAEAWAELAAAAAALGAMAARFDNARDAYVAAVRDAEATDETD